MRRIALAFIALLPLLPAQAAPESKGEAKLARLLEGRVAGEPVSCIQLSRITSSQVINDTAIVYRTGSTLYVNRPRAGAGSLSDWDVLVTRTTIDQLCSIDTVQTVDSSQGFLTGVVFLGEFVPYRRAGRE